MELNTIAASFGSLSTRLSELHSYLIPRYPRCSPATVDQLPEQNALTGFAKGLSEAHKAFCTHHSLASNDAVIVMVVQPGERNAFDQWWLQLKVWLPGLHPSIICSSQHTTISNFERRRPAASVYACCTILAVVLKTCDVEWCRVPSNNT